MEQQVVIEFLNLLGVTSIEFTDLQVRMSPHQYPQKVKRVVLDNRVVFADVDGEVKQFNTLSLPVRQTIGQRLRLMMNQQKI